MGDIRSAYGGGTVYPRRDGYVAQISVSVTIDGKEYNKRISGSGKTEKAAINNRRKNVEKWKKSLTQSLEEKKEKAQQAAEEAAMEKEWTLNKVFTSLITLKDASVQASTSDNYDMYYHSYVESSTLGRMFIKEITEEILLEFYRTTRLDGRKKVKKDKKGNPLEKKPLSVSTMNHIRFVLASTLQYATTKGIIEKNPHINIPPFKKDTAMMLDYQSDPDDMDQDDDDDNALERVIPLEEISKFLDYAFRYSRLAGLFAWALNSGMRQGECLALMRKHASPKKEVIYVKKSLAYIRDRKNEGAGKIPILKKPKNGKERTIPYNIPLKEIYEFQTKLIEKEKKEWGSGYVDRGLLFPDEDGNFLKPWKVLKEFQRIWDKLNLPQHRFHDLRHTLISLLIKESQKSGDPVSLLDICAIAGHSDATVTLRVYGNLFPNSTVRAMRTLNNCNLIKLPSENNEGLKFYA